MRRIAIASGMLLLALGPGRAAPASPTSSPKDPALGTWRGTVAHADSDLRVSVRIFREKGALRATLQSADLLMHGQPLEAVHVSGRNVRFTVPDDRPVHFEGVLDGDTLRGHAIVEAVGGVGWAHREGASMAFTLGRAKPEAAPPYAVRDVQVASGSVRLAATLYVPSSAGRHAGVVMLQGPSSKRRRDYASHADRFARAGLAVLLFERRGTGGSTGDYSSATYEQLAGDAAAAVAFLRQQREVDAASVGVWGVGQGALLAPMVAARVPEIRWLAVVSAPGLPPGENAAHRDSSLLAAKGFDAADIKRTVSLDRRLQKWLRDGEDRAELEALLVESSTTPWLQAGSIPPRLPAGPVPASWDWQGRTLDPAPAWAAVKVPVLAVYGAADELLPAKPNAKAIERALRSGENREVTVRTFPSANHCLRDVPRTPKDKWEWPRAAPGSVELMTDWMLERAHGQAASSDRN